MDKKFHEYANIKFNEKNLMRLSLACSMAFRVSLRMGSFAPRMGVSKTRNTRSVTGHGFLTNQNYH
jgi:hypothetical protein